LTIAEAEPTYYVGSKEYTSGNVYFYRAYDCMGERPVVMILVILHMFGLEHAKNTTSWDVMREYYYGEEWGTTDQCKQDITERDINYLKEIYG